MNSCGPPRTPAPSRIHAGRSPHNVDVQAVINPGSPGYALYPSAQVPLAIQFIRAIKEQRHARGGRETPSLVLFTKGVFPRCELRCEFCNESYAMSVADLDIVIAHAEAAPRG